MKLKRYWWAVPAVVGFFSLVLFSPPRLVPERAVVVVRDGMTVADIALTLHAAGVVYSEALVQTIIVMRGGEHEARSGAYLFEGPTSAWEAASRIMSGDLGVDIVTVRVPEGSTRVQMAALFEGLFPAFDSKDFLHLTEDEEGYLFPDTYFFFSNADATTIRNALRDTFDARIASLGDALHTSGKTLHEVVTMASIIEREASRHADQRLISGVLWRRIAEGMRLQVDAPFVYILGRGSHELTKEDLEIDSPFNTYRYEGLPPTPIASPGLGALEAALFPTPSDYLFYLSDASGTTHYARDFEEHKQNRVLYLD